MNQTLKFILKIIVTLALGAGAIFLALALMNNLYDYRSPLSAHPPTPGRSFTEPISERVVFVLVDGLRYDTAENSEVMPVLNQLRRQGASAKGHSQTPSYSMPGYGVLLTGAWPYLSDAPVFNLTYEEAYPFSQDNVFSAAKRFGLQTAASGYYWFEKLIPSKALDIGFFTPEEDKKADRAVVDAALPWLRSRDYNFIFIHLDQVDHAGHHEGGPQKEAWNQAASRVDGLLAEIVSELDFSKDTLLITSDHGHIDQGGHGGQDAIVLIEPFVLVGNGVKPGIYEDINQVDVAPTLSAFLGLNIPALAQGRVLSDMMYLPEKTLDAMHNETSRQQSKLLADYATAIGQPLPPEATNASPSITVDQYQKAFRNIQQNRINRERMIRFGIGTVALVLLIFIFWRWKPKGWVTPVLAAILYTVLYHLAYTTLGQKVYSYSSVASPTQLVVVNGLITLSAVIITWLLFSFQNWITLDLKQNLSKILDLTIVMMLITSIPLVVHILWNGLFATWMLPNIFFQYLALLSLVQIFFMGVAALLLLIVTTIILFSRKKKPA